MSSRGLRFFFRTRNQVSNRKNRYRLTAINFEAALYGTGTMKFFHKAQDKGLWVCVTHLR